MTHEVLCIGLDPYDADVLYEVLAHALLMLDDSENLEEQTAALCSIMTRIRTAGR